MPYTLPHGEVIAPPIELYDLKTDPKEMNNVASQNPEIIKKMKHFFAKEHRHNPDWPFLFSEIKNDQKARQ